MQDLIDQMLKLVNRQSWSMMGRDTRVEVTIAKVKISFDFTDTLAGLAFEQLASAIEATIAVDRARRMIEAVGLVGPLPLWLVSGSQILGAWLNWAGADNALRKVLELSDEVGTAPVAGYLDRRNRWELGQGGARIRVRGGMATAERIELSDRPRCTAMIGQTARIRIEGVTLPDTLIPSLEPDHARRSLADVVKHPFFMTGDLRIVSVTKEEPDIEFDVESRWAPLEPIPAAAWGALPSDADPSCPWRATAGERGWLDGLVEEARHYVAATRDRR